jgi:hypothetical protein
MCTIKEIAVERMQTAPIAFNRLQHSFDFLTIVIEPGLFYVLKSAFYSCIHLYTFVIESKALKDVYFMHNLAKT